MVRCQLTGEGEQIIPRAWVEVEFLLLVVFWDTRVTGPAVVIQLVKKLVFMEPDG
jgi:hypothetical protein